MEYDRIAVTHVGSLARPVELQAFIRAQENGEDYDHAAFEACLRDSVAEVVRRQAGVGIDVVSDGEFGKTFTWAWYIRDRLDGFEERPFEPTGHIGPQDPSRQGRDRRDYDEFYDDYFRRNPIASGVRDRGQAVCVGPIRYAGQDAIARDIADLKAGMEAAGVTEGFLPVVAPASTYWLENEHYATEEEFVYALADALAVEYNAIVDSGFMLQVDDAVLMHEMDSILAEGGSMKDYRDWAQLRVDALNHALKDIPPEKVRYHVCWGSWHGPHAFDPPLAEVVDLVLQVNAHAYMMEQANPRHEHEWRVWEDVKLPEGKMLIPGVVTHHTVIVEHPDLVADRLVRLAELVGPDNVMAGTDCGFAQTAFMQRVHPEVQWAKLTALAEGARIASDRLGVTA